MKIDTSTLSEIITEIAWQVGDSLDRPRAESRQRSIKIANDIINAGLIDNDSEDIDEIVTMYLKGVNHVSNRNIHYL